MANEPLKGMSMERVKVVEFKNQRNKIVDGSILFFFRVFSLKILYRSSLHFVGIRVFIVGYVRNVKIHFSAKHGVLATHSQLGQVASSSCTIIDRPNCHFFVL